jgi:DNA-binding NarL/FixJ family response regulator
MIVPVRVLIAEGNLSICAALERLLEHAPEVHVVAVASDGATALQLAAQHNPAVALLSVSLPLLDGRDVIASLRQRFPRIRIIGLGIYPAWRVNALIGGACRFLLLDAPRDQFLACIRDAAHGDCEQLS